MEIEKIYNNADNHEVSAYIFYAKVDHATFIFEEKEDEPILLYKDKAFAHPLTKEDVIGIPYNKIIIAGVDTTVGDVIYFMPSMVYCDNESKNVNGVDVINKNYKTEAFVKQYLSIDNSSTGGND